MTEKFSFFDAVSTEFILGGAAGIYLMDEGQAGLPPVENQITSAAQEDGGTFRDFRLRPRAVNLKWVTAQTSRGAMFTDRQTYLQAMKPTGLPCTLRKELPDGTKYGLIVYFSKGMELARADQLGTQHQQYVAQFIAPDPVWRKLPINNYAFTFVANTELVFPIDFPIVFGGSTIDETAVIAVTGTWGALPTFALVGPLTNVIITNNTLNLKLQLEDYVIAAGRTVTISLMQGAKSITDDLGTNLIGYLSADSDLVNFHLGVPPEVSGGNNTIRFQASAISGASAASLSWYSRFIGW